MKGVRALFDQLRRRKVLTTAAAYVVSSWLLVQVGDVLFPIYGLSDTALRALTTALIAGFPVIVVLSWFFDFSWTGIEKTIAAVEDSPQQNPAGLPDADGPSIAVLPMTELGAGADDGGFAAALTNDIVTGLTQSSHLLVRTSGTDFVAGPDKQAFDALGRQLRVKYLLHGSIRRSDEQLRVSVHLVEADTGMDLWSENYDRSLTAEAVFQVQDDIRERIVATLSDLHGVIYSSHGKRIKQRPTSDLKAYECLALALTYDKYISEDNHLVARDSLERAVELDPLYDEAWAHLSWVYMDEWVWGFNPLPDSASRALAAARKSIDLAPDNYHNHWLLSRVYYFLGDLESFRAAASRALELNDRDGTTLGLLGLYTAWSGDWEAGLAMLDRARQLNPNYPPYYFMPYGTQAYLQGDFREALSQFARVNLPDWPLVGILLAATHAQLQQAESVARQLDSLRLLGGVSTRADVTAYLSRSLPFQPGLVEDIGKLPIWDELQPHQKTED